MSTLVEVIPFHEHQIATVREGDTVFVALKPLVEEIGLTWHSQFERVKRHPVLSEGIRVTRIPSGGGVQESVVISLEMLPGFLATMQSDRITNAEVRERVILFQREAFHVLFEHFFGRRGKGGAIALPTTTELIRLVDRLRAEREPSVRAMFHAHLARLCDKLDLPLPPIEAIGKDAPPVEQFTAPFFAGLDQLREMGIAADHHRRGTYLAVNMPEIAALFERHGIACEVGAALREALRQHPAFVDIVSVNCRDGKTRRCWVFRRDRLDPPLLN